MDVDIMAWIREEFRRQVAGEIGNEILYGVKDAPAGSFDHRKDTYEYRMEWYSHYNFFCVDYRASKCKGPGRTIKGTLNPTLDVYICWRHLTRRKRIERNAQAHLEEG